MKCVKNYLPEDLDFVKIELFSDLHIGSKKCNYKLIQERIAEVKNNPNTYCIILGDVVNNSTKTSVGDVYEEELTPMEQVKKATELFRPIKDKILGVVTGNHERRSYKQDGIDLLYFMCAELGISDKYDYCAELIFVRVGRSLSHGRFDKNVRQVAYSIYIAHGDGQGGRTIGGKANGLEKRGLIVNSDIVITGHTHAPFTFRNKSYQVDYQNSCAVEKEQVFVNAAATLNYEEYAELYGMRPSSTESPKIILDGRYKKIKVTL